MQRRYALLAALMVALVLVPGAILASGFSPKSSPLAQKRGTTDGACHATAFRANISAGAGDGVCNGTCLATHARDRYRTELGDSPCQANRTLDRGRDRVHARGWTRLDQSVAFTPGKQAVPGNRTCSGRER